MKKILEVEDDKKIPLALGVRLRADGLQTIIAYEPSKRQGAFRSVSSGKATKGALAHLYVL